MYKDCGSKEGKKALRFFFSHRAPSHALRLSAWQSDAGSWREEPAEVAYSTLMWCREGGAAPLIASWGFCAEAFGVRLEKVGFFPLSTYI